MRWLPLLLITLSISSASFAGGEFRCGAFSELTSEEQRWYLRGYLLSLGMEAQELGLTSGTYQAVLARARDLESDGKRANSTDHPLEWLVLKIEERRKLALAGGRNPIGLQAALNAKCERQPAFALMELLPSIMAQVSEGWTQFELPDHIQREQDRFSH